MISPKKLSDIAVIYNGNSINKTVKQEKYMNDVLGWNYIGTKDIGFDGTITYKTGVIIPFSETKFRTAPAGTVFVCSEGGSAGKKTALVKEEVCFGNKLFAIVNKNDEFTPKYIYYYTRYEAFLRQFKSMASTLMGGITVKNFGNIKIPVPPLPEQERIVARIEELFSELDKAVETLKTTKQQLAVYRQAVLKEAFDVALKYTEKLMSIEEFLVTDRKGMSTGPFGTMIKKHEHKQDGVPMLGIENIGEGKFVNGNKIFVTKEKAKELKSFVLKSGDIIISRSGTVGEICAVPAYMEGALLSTNLMRVSLNLQKVLSEYFIYMCQSKGVVLDQVKELCKGSTRIFLNQTILKQIKFPIPSIAKQKEIISEIEARMSTCGSIEKTVDTALQQAEAMRQSILKQAFEGRL